MKSSWTKNEDHLRFGLGLGCACECDPKPMHATGTKGMSFKDPQRLNHIKLDLIFFKNHFIKYCN